MAPTGNQVPLRLISHGETFALSARFVLLLCLLFVLERPASGQVTTQRNLPYTRDATAAYRGDLYLPGTPGVHPAIVAIHGGSWRSGHKSELRRLCTALAADGYACFSIDYDTHPHSFPLSWQEARAAVAFVRAHATEYNVDPDRIAALGTSAGGQIAALLALAPEGPTTALPGASPEAGPVPPTPVPVAAAVLFNGGYDLHPRHWLLRRYLGGACEDIPKVCNDASPDFHVHPGAPPIFVGHGTHDRLIPYTQATTFVSLLQAAHDPVTPFNATGAGHSYWRNRHWFHPNLAAAEAFLAQTPPDTSSATAAR